MGHAESLLLGEDIGDGVEDGEGSIKGESDEVPMVAASAIPVPSMLIVVVLEKVVVLEEVVMLDDEVVEVVVLVIAASTKLVVELVIESVPLMTKRGCRRW